MRKMIIIGCMIAVSTVHGGVISSGDSAPMTLDLRTGARESTGDEALTYSSLWDGGEGATVTIAQDGTALVENLAGEGERMWNVQQAGTYVLTHTTYTNGVAGKVETATFMVTKNISSVAVGDIAGATYTGSAVTPNPVVADVACGYTLVNGTDYTLAYENNVNAGTATVTITGKGNYTGSTNCTFEIAPRNIADAVVTLGSGLTYNGKSQTQFVSSVKAGGLTVTFTVSNNTATDADTYTLTVTGTGNFTGTATKQFSIARKSIAGATVTLGNSLTYTGAAQSQSVSAVTIGGLNATFDTANNAATAAGTYTLTVTGTGNFTGSTTKQFTIAPKPLTAAMVGSVANATYSGSAHTPQPTVTDSARGVTLAKGTDYTLSWGANTAAGLGNVTVTGKGNYTGSVVRNFTIAKQVVTPPVLSSKAYTGGQQLATVPSSTLYDVAQNAGGVDVGQYDVKLRIVDSSNYAWPDVSGTDKIVKFSITKASNEWLAPPSIANWTYGQSASVPNMGAAKFGTAGVTYGALGSTRPTDAGSYTATFTVPGTANYDGLSEPVGFSITRKSIAGATVTLGPALVYNGLEQEQTVESVKIDGVTATYTVFGNKATDVGTYTLTATGTGNFTGTATAQWRIYPDGIVQQVTPYDGIYDGAGHGIEVTVTKPTGATVKYAYAANGPYATDAILFTNVTEGAVAVWYTVEAENYTTVTNSSMVKISPKTLTETMVTVEDVAYTYDGTAKTPTVTVVDGEPSIMTEDDYEVAYSDNVAAGTATATITVTGKGNYTGTVTKHFTIAKAEVTQPTASSKAYTGGLLKADVSSTVRYIAANDGGVNVGSYPVVLTLTDATNYRWKNGDSNPLNLTFSITKASNSWLTQPSIAGWTYGQAANAPNLGAAKFGNVQVSYSATPQNAGSYTATFTVPETANYSALSKSVPFAIARATYDMSGAKWNYAGEFTYDGGIKTVVVSGLPLGVSVSAYSGNSAVAPGTYTAHATLSYDTVNFNAPSIADLSWSIKSSEGSKLEEIFDDLPADITPDDAGGWKVTVTNDIDSTDLPIDIPDNLGHVTIDLRGHDLIGADGAAGSNTMPGGDGKSAIRVVAGDGSGGTATRLTIVTTGGDALVKGGDGGAGNPGGSGAAAIAVLGDCQAGVKIDVGAGVTVRGGRGGDSVSGRGGDGGAGIEGDVGTNDGTIIGGDGGDSASGDGGDGGPGVDGNIDVNNGSITGGDGGSSETGRGGDGGMGTTGDVGTNDGTISGGGGGGSAQGEDGEDGKPVDGTIGGGSGTIVKVKVPVPEVPSAEYTGEVVEPQVPASGLYAVSASGGTRPGSYPVMLTLLDAANYEWIPRDGATVNGALAVVTFVIVDPPPRIETEGGGKSGRENAASVTATYDGRGHGISVTVTYPPTGAKIRYARAAKGPFTDEKPLFTNAVDAAETWYVLSADGFDSVTNMATVTIVPKPLSAVMVAGKRLVEDAQGRVSAALTLADIPPCALTASDWELASWQPRASGGGTATVRGKGNYTGMLSVDVPNEMTVVFDAVYGNGGDVRTVTTQTPGSAYVLPLRAPQYRGYDFLGWFTEREGGSPVTSGRKVSLRDPDVVYAHWKIRSYRTTFELNGGTGDFSPLTFDYGSTYPELQVPAKAGYLFDGWWSTSDFAKGSEVCEDDAVPASDTTLYAKWLRRRLWYSEQAFHLESSAVWEGYLVDPGNGDSVVGTITLKAGKPNPRTGLAKLTATVLIAGERKVTVKGETFDGSLSAKAKDGRTLEIKLGASSMTGRFDRYEIDGALNVFTAKDAASKMRAAQELKLRQGVYMIAWDDAGWTGLSLTVAAKGKVKVSGTLADGTRVNAKSQLLVGERESAIAVSWAKKTSSVSFLMWFCEDGSIECSNLQGGLVAMAANARDGAYLVDGAAFRIDAAAIAAAIPGAETELLPDGLPVRMKGTKFDIDRAGRVSLLRDKSGFDLSKAGANPSGLKLTYSIRNCTFKGGFTVYANVAGRLKKVKVTVSGVVLGRKGYGTATVKKIGSWPVVIE